MKKEVGEFDGVYGPEFEFFRSGGVAVFVGVRLSPPLYGVQGPTPNTLHSMMMGQRKEKGEHEVE